MSADRFRTEIMARLREGGLPRLVSFVHGYNVSHEQAVQTFRRFASGVSDRLQGTTVTVGYSWPSEGLTTHYLDDRGEARYAGEQLAAVMVDVRQLLERERCEAQLSVVAHSMGAYALAWGAQHAAEAMGWPKSWPIFQEVVLLAPDLDAEALEPGHVAAALPVFARRVTIYWSRHDGALLASSAKRGGLTGPRLGRHGPARTEALPAHVVDVDCSDVVRGHSEYLEREPVREDLRLVLAGEDRHEIDGRNHLRGSRFSLPAPAMEGLPCD